MTSINLKQTFEEVKLVYSNKTKAADRQLVNTSNLAYEVLFESWDQDQIDLLEEFKMLLLDRSGRLMSIASISKGGMAGTIVDPKVIFSIALKRRAHSLIIAHNHPSQNLKPSAADVNITHKLKSIGKSLNLEILDHLIVSSDGYYSMCDEGLIMD